jgi:hypothetical protein
MFNVGLGKKLLLKKDPKYLGKQPKKQRIG